MLLATGAVQIPITLVNRKRSLLINSALVALYFIVFIIVIWIAWKAYKRYANWKPRKLTLDQCRFVVLCYVIAMLIEMFLNYLNSVFNKQVMSVNNRVIVNTLEHSHITLVAMAVSMVLLSPVLEELVFRGFFMDAFFPAEAIVSPIILSAFVFASGHLTNNLISFGTYVVIGMFLAFVYRRTKNIKASMLLHALNNFIAALPMILLLWK